MHGSFRFTIVLSSVEVFIRYDYDFYAVALCLWQVIVQALRESGVFGSVIASANASMSEEESLTSVPSRNSSRKHESGQFSSRKIGSDRLSQAKARRILGDMDGFFEPLAVPPLSPPGLDSVDLNT